MESLENAVNDPAKLLNCLNELLNDPSIINESNERLQRGFVITLEKIFGSTVDSDVVWTALSCLKLVCYKKCNSAFMQFLQKNLLVKVTKLMPLANDVDKIEGLLGVLQMLSFNLQVDRLNDFIEETVRFLLQWSESDEETISRLSLSVLSNLLHNNSATLYVLRRNTDVKNFIKKIMTLHGSIFFKMETCKLMFILGSCLFEKPEEEEIVNFIKVSLLTIYNAASSGNISSLQHCIFFFEDMVKKGNIERDTLNQACFSKMVKNIINQLDVKQSQISIENAMLIFKFIGILVEMKIQSYAPLYSEVMHLAEDWVLQHKFRSTDALITMSLIVTYNCKFITRESLNKVFLPLLNGLGNTCSRSENIFFATLFKFLRGLLEKDDLKATLKEHLKPEMIESYIKALLKNTQDVNNNKVSETLVALILQLLDFMKVVACSDASWMNLYSSLLLNEQILSILSQALVNGDSNIKAQAISMICTVAFPEKSIPVLAKTLEDFGCKPLTGSPIRLNCDNIFSRTPINPSSSREIDSLIKELQDLKKRDKLQEISVVQLLQLYELKERDQLTYQDALRASLAKASEERILVESELSAAHQIISVLQRELTSVEPTLKNLKLKYEDSVKSKEIQLTAQRETFSKDLEKFQSACTSLNQTVEKLQRLNDKNLQKIKKLQEELEGKDDEIKRVNEKNESLVLESAELTSKLQQVDEKLLSSDRGLKEVKEKFEKTEKIRGQQVAELEAEKAALNEEIKELRRIKDTVFALTSGSRN